MAYLKLDDLFKLIVTHAESDRLAFIDAFSDDSPMIEETRIEIENIKAISGMSFKSAMIADQESVRLACMFAEYWYEGLADANLAGREFIAARSMFKKIRTLRLRCFGLTRTEVLIRNGRSCPVKDVMSNAIHQQSADEPE